MSSTIHPSSSYFQMLKILPKKPFNPQFLHFSSNSKSLHKTLTKPNPRPSASATAHRRRPPLNPAGAGAAIAPNLSPAAQSICSLLSSPSFHPKDINFTLKDLPLTSALVLETLRNYPSLGRANTLLFFSWAAARLRFRLDAPLLDYIADFLCRRKLFDDLRCLFRTVASHGGRVTSRSVAISIRFLGRDGRFDDALALFEAMETELNCRPDNLVYNNVLYVLCKRGFSGDSVKIALAVFRRIGRPDVYSYSNILVGLCRMGRVEDALEVFQEMGRADLAPTRTAANSLIGQLCEVGGKKELVGKVRVENFRQPFDILVPNLQHAKCGIQPAVEVFQTLCKLGLLPSAHVVNGLILELCKLGRIEEAVGIVKVVEDRKLRCLGESYSIVTKAFCEAFRMGEACDLFRKMVSQGFKPKVGVYDSVIRAFCKLGNVLEARKYFKIMNKTRCEPDCATYTMLIHANCRIQDWETAYELLMEMIGLGWNPHVDTYNLVDGLLKSNGRLELSRKLERKMEIQNLCSHCKAGHLEDAYNKLSSMIDKGFYPPIYARDLFERAFHKSGKWKMAQKLLDKMDQIINQNDAQA